MRIAEEDGDLKIEGPGADRTTIAYPSQEGGRLVYGFAHRKPLLAIRSPTVTAVPQEETCSRVRVN
jgi:hypothetical protein